VARPILTECLARLTFLKELGLGYLTLDRSGETLSGGEAQRIRLSSELGSNLTGVCYILDEPTIGLHPRDNALLIKALQSICTRGNSVLVVEHDEETLLAADWVIDLGPGGGDRGGEVVFQGEPQELESAQESSTALMLREEGRYAFTSRERGTHCLQWLSIEGASARNLRIWISRSPWGPFPASPAFPVPESRPC
jgi:excinuclease ABC subunit A